MKKTLAVFAVLVALPLLASAGEPLTIADTVLANAQIEAIDHDARELTLVDAGGGSANVRFGREIENFKRLNVGDLIDVTYTQALVISVLPSTAPGHVLVTALALQGRP